MPKEKDKSKKKRNLPAEKRAGKSADRPLSVGQLKVAAMLACDGHSILIKDNVTYSVVGGTHILWFTLGEPFNIVMDGPAVVEQSSGTLLGPAKTYHPDPDSDIKLSFTITTEDREAVTSTLAVTHDGVTVKGKRKKKGKGKRSKGA